MQGYREQCKKRLLDMVEEAYLEFRKYYPDSISLSLFGGKDGFTAMGCKRSNGKVKIIVDCFKTNDGHYRFGD